MMKLEQIVLENQKMRDYFDLLSKGQKLDTQWKECRDAMGFTPLHYALILGNDKNFLSMVKAKFRFFSKEQYQVYEKTCPYDLCVWAEYLNKDYTEDIFLYTSYEAKCLSAMIKIEKAHLFVQKRAIEMSRKMESVQRKRIRAARQKRYYGLPDEERRLYDILDNRRVLEQAKMDIENTLIDLENELEQLYIGKRKSWKEQAQKLRTSENAFDKKIREIIGNPYNLLAYLLLEREQWCKFYYLNCEIFIPKDWNITEQKAFDRKTKTNKCDEGAVHKPYGDKWFSPAAYRDRNTLKAEYRELGKKYHPDNNNDLDTTAIFQDILAERMEILEAYI